MVATCLVWCRPNVRLRTENIIGRRRRLHAKTRNDRRTGRYRRLRGPARVWQGPGNLQGVDSGSSGKNFDRPQHLTECNFRIRGQFVHYTDTEIETEKKIEIIASVLGHWVSGTTPKALATSRSLRSKLNLAMTVAEVSDDRVLWQTRTTRQNSFLIPSPDWSL